MTCRPFTVEVGVFSTNTSWETSNSTQGGKSVTIDSNGNITVTYSSNSLTIYKANDSLEYMFIGSNNYLLINDRIIGQVDTTNWIYLIIFKENQSPEKKFLFTISTTPMKPYVHYSRNTGTAFLIFGYTGPMPNATISDCKMYRSDNGDLLLSGPLSPSMTSISGEATDTELIIHYDTGEFRCQIPCGKLTVNPSSLSFEAILGGPDCVASPKKTVTLKNDGNDCLIVNSIQNASPFTVSSTNPSIPASLDPDQSMTVEITFSPNSVGQFPSRVLQINCTPSEAMWQSTITCNGECTMAEPKINVPTIRPIDFNRVQQGFRTVRYIIVENIGTATVTFKAKIEGADSSFFGIQPPSGSITDVLNERIFTIEPTNICEGILTTEIYVPVTFYANDNPRNTFDAQLIIKDHNATNTTQPSWTYILNAEIIAPEPIDTALILDRSGSMAELAGVRPKVDALISGARLFVELIRENYTDRISIIKYNQRPEIVQSMVEITDSNKSDVINKINNQELNPSGSTAIAGGIMIGLEQMAIPRAAGSPASNKVMVLLSDGKENTAYIHTDNNYYSIFGGYYYNPNFTASGSSLSDALVFTIPIPAIPEGIKIYSIGLGREENVEKEKLSALSSSTGAYFGAIGNDLVGKHYFDLEKYFIQIFMDMNGDSIVMDPVYTIQPGQKHVIEFDVLQGDVSALIVILDFEGKRLPFVLITPKGEKIDPNHIPQGFQLRSGYTDITRFIQIRMPQGTPDLYKGRWSVVIEHQNRFCYGPPAIKKGSEKWGFLPEKCVDLDSPLDYGIAIGVGSNFRMQPYVQPGIIRTGEPILLTAIVSEAGIPIIECRVSVRAETPSGAIWNLTLLDDGSHDDGESNDGEYARQFTKTEEAGSYIFRFQARGLSRDGEPVTREAVRVKYVEGRFGIKEPGPKEPGFDFRDCCKQIIHILKENQKLIRSRFRNSI